MKSGVISRYNVIDGRAASRYWVHDRILVGGEIISPADGAQLVATTGVTHSLSMQNEHNRLDEGKFPGIIYQAPIPDVNEPISPQVLYGIIAWCRSVFDQSNTALYCHCQLGFSRSPTMAWMLLRAVFGFDREAAFALIRTGREDPQWAPHPLFEKSVDAALAALTALT